MVPTIVILALISGLFAALSRIMKQRRLRERDREEMAFVRHVFDQTRQVILPELTELRRAQRPIINYKTTVATSDGKDDASDTGASAETPS